jgi:dipeptidyl aminopeptidase/acylaminoacyl peptidase
MLFLNQKRLRKNNALADMSYSIPPLIPRRVLLGAPKRWQPTISPDGERLAYLAPDDRDILQIWVRTLGNSDDRCVSRARRPVWFYAWSRDSKTVFCFQDQDGDENWHVHAIDLESQNVRDLTPWQGVRCHYIVSSPTRPNEILALLNVRNRKLMDVWRIDLRTGATTLEVENPGDVAWWIADDNLAVRASRGWTPQGGAEVRVRSEATSPWRTLVRTSPEEEAYPLGFSKDGKEVFLRSSVGRDTVCVVAVDIESRREREIAAMDGFDAEDVMIHAKRRAVDAVRFAPERRKWVVQNPELAADFESLAGIDDGDLDVVSRDLEDSKWIVAFTTPHRPIRYHLWNRGSKSSTFLFSHRPELEQYQLAEMRPITYRARDGLEVRGYLTIPPGHEPRRLPLVLHPHGGPWARDYWGFNVWCQFLANRGYAVLQSNFRGSTGYGRKFLHAGDRQWGLAMQNDLTDAVKWAVAEGIADPDRVAIFGLSYGGYAALAGAAFTPDLYKCAIDLCGPSNLATCIKSFAPYFNMRAVWNSLVGNPDDSADRELLAGASPLFAADKIRIPMLIGQGANDARVIQAESEQIVEAIEKNGGSTIYVLYPDEGHGLARPENNQDFMARAERFLAEHLGGRYEPVEGERIPGSSPTVRTIEP